MIAKEIRELRERLGETRGQFALRFDVSEKTVERWEYDVKHPPKGPAKILLEQINSAHPANA